MKNFLFLFIAFLAIGFSGFAQKTEERQVGHFTKIKAGTSFDVIVRKGSEEKVVVEAQSGDLDKIITEVDGNTLNIGAENSWWGSGSIFRGVKVYVTFRELNELHASGSGSVRLESALAADELRLSSSGSGSLICEQELSSGGDMRISNSGSGSCRMQGVVSARGEVRIVNSGSGSISIEELNGDAVSINNSGSGGLKVNGGSVNSQSIVLSGSGSLRLGYSSVTCHVRKSGSGSIHADVREELTGDSSGSGNIYLTGGRPRQDINNSGSGRIKHE